MNIPNIFNCKVSIIGLGYVGLPLAIEISKTKICKKSGKPILRETIGFDLNKYRLNELRNGFDKTCEFSGKELGEVDILYTDQEELLINTDIFIVTVPTPINNLKEPDLSYLKKASQLIGKAISFQTKKIKPIIVYESTVFPSATEKICVPILEKSSKKIFNSDFYCGYSPERVNPGDKKYRLNNIVKVTSGSTIESAKCIDDFYGSIIDAGTFPAVSIQVAEAAKVIENTQRDINIALVNELAAIFDKLGIDTLDVLDTASTKWNFLNFRPGLVGGHCIGIDPYYLTWISRENGYEPNVILCGRDINEKMVSFVLEKVQRKAKEKKINFKKANLLILGYTFKENCPDSRNTKVLDLVKYLINNEINFSIYDPVADTSSIDDSIKDYFIPTLNIEKKFNIILLLVPHKVLLNISNEKYQDLLYDNGFIYDLKGQLINSCCIIRP